MEIPIFQINAFATKVFSGNPAAVCPLHRWLDDDSMQKIASESRMITAFIVGGDAQYELRWFNATKEIHGICGRGTLAASMLSTWYGIADSL